MQFEPTVTVINRVRDAKGAVVPYEFYFDGDAVKIWDKMDLPFTVAQVAIHHSMYAFDIESGVGQYRLGCTAEGLTLPIDPIPVSDTERTELVDRDALLAGRNVNIVKKPVVVRRHDPLTQRSPGNRDGAFAAGFGDAYVGAQR